FRGAEYGVGLGGEGGQDDRRVVGELGDAEHGGEPGGRGRKWLDCEVEPIRTGIVLIKPAPAKPPALRGSSVWKSGTMGFRPRPEYLHAAQDRRPPLSHPR